MKNEVRQRVARLRWDRVIEARRSAANFDPSDPEFMAGLALYWAEGSKKHAQFTNSDHRAVTFIVGWMRKYLDAEMGTVQLFLHRNQDAEKAIGFWEAKLKRRIAVHVRQKDSRSAAGYGCVQVEFAQQGITAKIIREWIAEVFGEE